jgi:hypothetical protein
MRKLVGALLAVIVAACNSDGTTSPGNATLAGDYQLQTANGKAVPTIAIQDQTGTFEVLRGRIVLRGDLSFVDTLYYRTTAPGGTPQAGSDIRQGTYVQTGDNVTLTFQTSNGSFVDYPLTWINGNTLAYGEPQLSLIYKK